MASVSSDNPKKKVLNCVPIVEALIPATEKAVASPETAFTVTPLI